MRYLLLLTAALIVAGCAENKSKAPAKGGVEVNAPGVKVKVGDKGTEVTAPGVDVKTKKDG